MNNSPRKLRMDIFCSSQKPPNPSQKHLHVKSLDPSLKHLHVQSLDPSLKHLHVQSLDPSLKHLYVQSFDPSLIYLHVQSFDPSLKYLHVQSLHPSLKHLHVQCNTMSTWKHTQRMPTQQQKTIITQKSSLPCKSGEGQPTPSLNALVQGYGRLREWFWTPSSLHSRA